MSTDPTAPFGLDLRQAVTDHLGHDPRLDVEVALDAARRALNWLLPSGILVRPDSVTVKDPSADVAAAMRDAWAAVDLDVVIAELRPVTVAMTISGKDFERLVISSHPWDLSEWGYTEDDHPFESTTGRAAEKVGDHWRYAYRMGEQWSDVMLARAYLDAVGDAYQILWDPEADENGDPGGYLILTDYATASWYHRPAVPTPATPTT